jgi:hypothetical protein
VFGFALKHIDGGLKRAGNIFGKDFFDLLELVSHWRRE